MASLASLGGANGSDSIATEVQILKSPSVLLPVFEKVKSLKPSSVASGMRFEDWRKSTITAEEEQAPRPECPVPRYRQKTGSASHRDDFQGLIRTTPTVAELVSCSM